MVTLTAEHDLYDEASDSQSSYVTEDEEPEQCQYYLPPYFPLYPLY